MNQFTGIVKHLIIINVIIFFGAMLMQSSFPAIQTLLPLYFPESPHFFPSQIVTHMFMHANTGHLLFNMLTLFFLGPYVEKYLGSRKFLFFYLFAGFGAMISHLGINYIQYYDLIGQMDSQIVRTMIEEGRTVRLPEDMWNNSNVNQLYGILNIPVVGASGAIYGVLIAFAMFFPNMRLMLLFPPIPIKARYLALGLIAFDLFAGISGQRTGIAHFAHLGGALFGFLLIMYWRSKYGKR